MPPIPWAFASYDKFYLMVPTPSNCKPSLVLDVSLRANIVSRVAIINENSGCDYPTSLLLEHEVGDWSANLH